MLNAANRAAARLWRDESGVVLAVTMVVFLALFMMACAVYAVGETARQRVPASGPATISRMSGIRTSMCARRLASIRPSGISPAP